MAEDYSLAAKAYVPQGNAKDPLETLQGIERWRILQNQHTLTGLEAKQKEIDTNALADWKNTRSPASLYGATPSLRNEAAEGENREMQNRKDMMARDAGFVANEKDPKIQKYLWNKFGEEYKNRGWISGDTWEKLKDRPNPQVLENIQRWNVNVPDWRQTTGETAGAEAAARAAYEYRELDPTKRSGYPAVQPGGPLQSGSPVGRTLTAPGAQPGFGEPSGTGPRPPGTVNLTDTKATVLPGVPGTPSAAPGRNVQAVDKTNPYSDQVPEVNVGHDYAGGKGVVSPGVDPIRQQARVEGQKKYSTEIEPEAAAAAKTRAELGTMKAKLDKGVTSDRLAELKTSLAGFLYGVTKDQNFVKNITGLDLANQEVMNKETTRMGLTFARQTEGAREAVAAIRIALGANPSLINSEAGNRQIINIMDQSAKYEQERSKAAQAWMQKNDGHLQGFDTWWSTNHSPATFISKAVPYAIPSNARELQNGVTYEFKLGNKSRIGTWNADSGHMEPVNP